MRGHLQQTCRNKKKEASNHIGRNSAEVSTPHLCGETHGTKKGASPCPETQLVSGIPLENVLSEKWAGELHLSYIGRSALGRLSKRRGATRRVATTDKPRRSLSQLQGLYAPGVRFRNYFHAFSTLRFPLRYDTAVHFECLHLFLQLPCCFSSCRQPSPHLPHLGWIRFRSRFPMKCCCLDRAHRSHCSRSRSHMAVCFLRHCTLHLRINSFVL